MDNITDYTADDIYFGNCKHCRGVIFHLARIEKTFDYVVCAKCGRLIQIHLMDMKNPNDVEV